MTNAEVAEAGKRIRGIMDERAELQFEGNVDVGSRARSMRNLIHEMTATQDGLAAEFGRRHGWSLAHRRFNVPALAGNKIWSYVAPCADRHEFCYPEVDHGVFYRFPDARAAAVAAHLYAVGDEDEVGRLSAWATDHGLAVSFPTDFPSWYLPGGTLLAIYRSARELENLGARPVKPDTHAWAPVTGLSADGSVLSCRKGDRTAREKHRAACIEQQRPAVCIFPMRTQATIEYTAEHLPAAQINALERHHTEIWDLGKGIMQQWADCRRSCRFHAAPTWGWFSVPVEAAPDIARKVYDALRYYAGEEGES